MKMLLILQVHHFKHMGQANFNQHTSIHFLILNSTLEKYLENRNHIGATRNIRETFTEPLVWLTW